MTPAKALKIWIGLMFSGMILAAVGTFFALTPFLLPGALVLWWINRTASTHPAQARLLAALMTVLMFALCVFGFGADGSLMLRLVVLVLPWLVLAGILQWIVTRAAAFV